MILLLLLACTGRGAADGKPNDSARDSDTPAGDSDTVAKDSDSVSVPTDADGDGFYTPEDCNDSDPDVNPDVEEVCYNMLDDDCTGVEACADVEPTWSLVADGSESWAMSVLPVRDRDGDGLDELWLAAQAIPGEHQEWDSYAYVWLSGDLDPTESRYDSNSEASVLLSNPGEGMGPYVGVMDLDGDGIDDLASVDEDFQITWFDGLSSRPDDAITFDDAYARLLIQSGCWSTATPDMGEVGASGELAVVDLCRGYVIPGTAIVGDQLPMDIASHDWDIEELVIGRVTDGDLDADGVSEVIYGDIDGYASAVVLSGADIHADAASVSDPFMGFEGEFEDERDVDRLYPYVPGDLDQDGADDLVMWHLDVHSFDVYLSGSIARGGTFSQADATTVLGLLDTNGVQPSAVPDQDGDGGPELWVRQTTDGESFLLLSSALLSGGGVWDSATDAADLSALSLDPVNPWCIYGGSDLSGDGVPDLVVGDFKYENSHLSASYQIYVPNP